jgi:hypothetical protein
VSATTVDFWIAEDSAPLADAAVARQQDGASLVTAFSRAGRTQMRRVGLERQITQFVDDQELWLGEQRKPLLDLSFAI